MITVNNTQNVGMTNRDYLLILSAIYIAPQFTFWVAVVLSLLCLVLGAISKK